MTSEPIPIPTRLMQQYVMAAAIDRRHKPIEDVVKIAIAADDPIISQAVKLSEYESDNLICACFLVLEQRLQRGHITKAQFDKAVRAIETKGESYE